MLDCDKCHRWFHGKCVGIQGNDTSVPTQWFCDACQLSSAVAKQRQRMNRLLSLKGESDQGDSSEQLELMCSETEVTKQLILNYLQVSFSFRGLFANLVETRLLLMLCWQLVLMRLLLHACPYFCSASCIYGMQLYCIVYSTHT